MPDCAVPRMNQTPTRQRPPVFVIVACVLSAVVFGFICWNSTLRSDAEPTTRDYSFLLLYQCLSLISYLAALWFFTRLSNFRGTEIIVVLFLISIFGTILPYVATSVQIWATHQLELGWFLRQSAVAWLLLNVGMLVMMAVTASVGFLLTLPFRHTTRNIAGI
jgi:hypothetical protein